MCGGTSGSGPAVQVWEGGLGGVQGAGVGERHEGAPGSARVVEGAEAEVKGPPSWPGLSHTHLGSWGPWSLQRERPLGEPWPDPALARPCSGHLLARRPVPVETSWLLGPHPPPTVLPLPNRFPRMAAHGWSFLWAGRQPLRPHFTELPPQERAALPREEESRAVGGAASQMCL